MEEVDDLLQGFLGLVLPGYILKGDAGGFLHIHLGIGLADAADAADTAAALAQQAHHQQKCPQHQNRGQDIGDHKLQNGAHLLHHRGGVGHMMLLQQVVEIVAVDLRGVKSDLGFLGVGVGFGLLAALVGIDIAIDGGGEDLSVFKLHPGDFVLSDQIGQGAEIHLEAGGLVGRVAGIGGKIVKTDGQHYGPGQQHQHTPKVSVIFAVFVVLVVF